MEQLLKQLIGEMQSFRSEVNTRLDGLEQGQAEANVRLERLEQGQAEIKEIMKHNFTLQTENFTQIRKEIRIKNQSVQADINLLFEEKEVIKRKVNKIEHSLGI